MAATIYRGQRVLVEIKARLAGVPTDPTVMRCLIRRPDGSQVTLTYPNAELTRKDVGLFEVNVTVAQAGSWRFRGEAAGVVDGIEEIEIAVADTLFT